jgi:hypothetical protein
MTPAPQHAAAAPELAGAVRKAVRTLLEQAPGWREAPPALRSALAKKMARVSLTAAALLDDDRKLSMEVDRRDGARRPIALAEAQAAGRRRGTAAAPSPLAGFAAPNAAGAAIQSLRTALDFPTYVTQLITGVFRAISTSTLQQMQALSDLLDNVTATSDAFAQRNIPSSEASRWAAERYPFLQRDGDGNLRLREGADTNAAASALRELGAPRSALDGDDVGEALMPYIQRRMGRDRQAILGTIIQLGLQRVVVDEGRLHASMDMRVDARSLQERTRQSQTGVDFHTSASGNFSMGLWGASANMGLAVTTVNADSEYHKDELTAQAGLRSSVDLAFRTEQVPLDRMAGSQQRARLDAVALVPANVGTGTPLTTGPTIAPATTLTPPTRADAPQAPTPPGRTEGGNERATTETAAPVPSETPAETPTPAAQPPTQNDAPSRVPAQAQRAPRPPAGGR